MPVWLGVRRASFSEGGFPVVLKRDPMIRIEPIRQAKRARGSPGFPVQLGGVGGLHAAFPTESRTRSRGMEPRTGNPDRGFAEWRARFCFSVPFQPCSSVCEPLIPAWWTFAPGKTGALPWDVRLIFARSTHEANGAYRSRSWSWDVEWLRRREA